MFNKVAVKELYNKDPARETFTEVLVELGSIKLHRGRRLPKGVSRPRTHRRRAPRSRSWRSVEVKPELCLEL